MTGARCQELPTDRRAVTRKIEIRAGGPDGSKIVDVYATVGLYEDGRPGELFVRVGKAGSVVSGAFDVIGALASLALQSGVPLETVLDKMRGTRFEPSGPTGDPELGIALSICDVVAKWMQARFGARAPEGT